MLCLGKTNIGMKRSVNQDNFRISEFGENSVLAVVCDGMGGAAGGATASDLAATTFTDFISARIADFTKKKFLTITDERRVKNLLKEAVRRANDAVFEAARNDESLRGMGTTLVATLLLAGDLYTVNVGDSRMYLISGDKIEQVTHDHSYVQYLVDMGRITPEEAKTSTRKNIITRAVGTTEEVEADVFVSRAEAGKSVAILCSDGLANYVSEDELLYDVTKSCVDYSCEGLSAWLDDLIERANDAGGSDNITAVILSV